MLVLVSEVIVCHGPVRGFWGGTPAGVGVCMKKQPPAESSPGVVYQVRLPVPKRTVDLVGQLIRRRRKQLGTRWRKAAPGTQAIVVPAVLRLADMAGGNSVFGRNRPPLGPGSPRSARRPGPASGPCPEEDRPSGRCGGPAGRHPRAHPPPHRGGQPQELQRETQDPCPALPRTDRREGKPDLDPLRPPRHRRGRRRGRRSRGRPGRRGRPRADAW